MLRPAHGGQKFLSEPETRRAKVFKHRGEVKSHVQKLHRLGDVLKCAQCNYETKEKGTLSKHVYRVHKGKKLLKYSCSHCSYKTDNKHNFVIHRRAKHDDSMIKLDLFHCKLCPYETIYRQNLKVHLNEFHELAELLECDKCNHRTRSMAKLKVHQKVVHKKRSTGIMGTSSL